MLSTLQSATVEGTQWLDPFVQDFKLRFRTLLAGAFKSFPPGLAMSIVDPKITFTDGEASGPSGDPVKSDGSLFSAYDLKRLQVRISNSYPGDERNSLHAQSKILVREKLENILPTTHFILCLPSSPSCQSFEYWSPNTHLGNNHNVFGRNAEFAHKGPDKFPRGRWGVSV